MKPSYRPILAALSLVACFLVASPSVSARETWTMVSSQNFTVVGNASNGKLKEITQKLEQFRHVLSMVFPKTRLKTPVPTTVIVFRDDDSFKPFKPTYKGKTKDDTAGYFFSTPHQNFIVFNADAGSSPFRVIFHEYEHYVIRNNFPNAPAWLDEGLAEFVSTFETNNDETKGTLGSPIGYHVGVLRNRPMIPLADLFRVTHKSPEYNEWARVGVFYAQSWALVHYLMMAEDGKRSAQLSRFISLSNSDRTIEESFREAFQCDYKQMSDELQHYVMRFSFPAVTYTFASQLDYAKAVQSRTLTEAEAAFHLGDLMLQRRSLAEAEHYLTKSLEADPNFSPARTATAWLRLLQKRPDEARKLLDAVLAQDAGNYLAAYFSGVERRTAGNIPAAVEAFKKALEMKPDSAVAMADLGYLYEELGREEDAKAMFRKSYMLDPSRSVVLRALSNLCIRTLDGNGAAAYGMGYIRREGWDDDSAPYMALNVYLGYRQAGNPAAARAYLDANDTKFDRTGWPYRLVTFFRGETSGDELVSAAKNNDQLTEAHAYVGLDLSLKGEFKNAIEHLTWVKEKGNRNFVEYKYALAELKWIAARQAAPAK